MAIRTSEPWRHLDELTRKMERLFASYPSGGSDDATAATADWVPAVDIKENQYRFTVIVDVPGVEPRDIDVTTANGVLVLRGERSGLEAAADRGAFKRLERSRGTFYRRFILPNTADIDKISAHASQGVLEITVPKQQSRKLAHLQLASLQDYSDMSIAQLRAALEVSDAESLQAYVAKQSEFFKHLSEKLTADARAVAELSKEFGEGAQQLAEESVEPSRDATEQEPSLLSLKPGVPQAAAGSETTLEHPSDAELLETACVLLDKANREIESLRGRIADTLTSFGTR